MHILTTVFPENIVYFPRPWPFGVYFIVSQKKLGTVPDHMLAVMKYMFITCDFECGKEPENHQAE